MGDRKIRNLVRKTSGLTEVRNDENTWDKMPSCPTFSAGVINGHHES